MPRHSLMSERSECRCVGRARSICQPGRIAKSVNSYCYADYSNPRFPKLVNTPIYTVISLQEQMVTVIATGVDLLRQSADSQTIGYPCHSGALPRIPVIFWPFPPFCISSLPHKKASVHTYTYLLIHPDNF
jgi:hypothetical protein